MVLARKHLNSALSRKHGVQAKAQNFLAVRGVSNWKDNTAAQTKTHEIILVRLLLKNDATDGKNVRKIYDQEKYERNDGNSTRKFYEKNGKGGKLQNVWYSSKNDRTILVEMDRRWWIRSSRVNRASDCRCQSRNSPGFDLCILRHKIWGKELYGRKIRENSRRKERREDFP